MSELRAGDTGETEAALLHSPLHAEHVALGATMGAFGGWDMPISYAGAGVVAEHTAVRTAVGIFDVSHLGKASVTGPGAAAFVNDCLTADLAKLAARSGAIHHVLQRRRRRHRRSDRLPGLAGRGLPDPERGQHRRRGRRVAGRGARRASRWSTGTPTSGCWPSRGRPRTRCCRRSGCPTNWTTCPGPTALSTAGRSGSAAPDTPANTVTNWSRPGTPPPRSGRRWSTRPACAAAGRPGSAPGTRCAPRWATPCTARTSARTISPVQARVGWAVGWRKPELLRPGRAARRTGGRAAPGVLGSAGAGPRRAARPPRRAGRGEQVIGQTTSGTFSPTLGQGIGLALIDTDRRGRGGRRDRRRRARPPDAGAGGQAAVRALPRALIRLPTVREARRIRSDPIVGRPTICDIVYP